MEYQVATLYKIALFPTKTGNLEISPMSVTAQVRTKQKGKKDPFGMTHFSIVLIHDCQKINSY
ncbi:MAG: hypothetical protein CM1200mP10_15880 [Candidatus Neomarinimicrobiota bacterium]|nr:MAG: hypothetical protein CM1200mP10_15880 [Candidatus Neomarinimicrobiota bacterium]